eukprot:scaffold131255_cov29-Prasinocladus_malaysianus.AAC.1
MAQHPMLLSARLVCCCITQCGLFNTASSLLEHSRYHAPLVADASLIALSVVLQCRAMAGDDCQQPD